MTHNINGLKLSGFGPSPVLGSNFHVANIQFDYVFEPDEFGGVGEFTNICVEISGCHNGKCSYREIEFGRAGKEVKAEILDAMAKEVNKIGF